MSPNALPPLTVTEYNRDYLIEFVRHHSNWSERSEVAAKAQINYLCEYLEVDHIACKTIVVESSYTDRHYLEDYSEYYSACFVSYPKRCARLHFFSQKISESDFLNALADAGHVLRNQLNGGYLGFVVLRPIAHTIFARICLAPYAALLNSDRYLVLAKDVAVSLFGIDLTVKTIPLIEQDRVVSDCTIAALWTMLAAHPNVAALDAPSPSQIRRAIAVPFGDLSRSSNSGGLVPDQICSALSAHKLTPAVFWGDAESEVESLEDLKAQIYGYLSLQTPVMLGGALYEKKNNKTSLIGHHLFCVVGRSIDISREKRVDELNFSSAAIDKLYIHDDRYGPYVRLAADLTPFKVDNKKERRGLHLKNWKHSECYLIPTIAIAALDPRIKIGYSSVSQACSAFFKHLAASLLDLTDSDKKNQNVDVINSVRALTESWWELSLLSGADVKKEAVRSASFLGFNGSINKPSFALTSLPKHLWRCRLYTQDGPKQLVHTDLLFDTTAIPQGSMFLGYLAYSSESVTAWQYVDERIRRGDWQRHTIAATDANETASCFFRFFSSEDNNSFLNSTYGAIGLPRRSLKPGETDKINNIPRRTDVYTFERGVRGAWDFMDHGKKYIWVIDVAGKIVIGEDIVRDESSFQGHPTLINGRPGRIGGELLFDKSSGQWRINLKSRAYSGHIDLNTGEDGFYMNNVIQHNLQGLSVSIAPR